VVYLSIFGKPIIVLTTAEAINDLLDRRGANFSDRPSRPLLEMSGAAKGVGSSPYGQRLVRMRRMILSVGGKSGAERYAHVLYQERHRFLRRLLEDPTGSQVAKHIRTSVSSRIVLWNRSLLFS
jgi:hypothetical protein